jgi:hypothetical protein
MNRRDRGVNNVMGRVPHHRLEPVPLSIELSVNPTMRGSKKPTIADPTYS